MKMIKKEDNEEKEEQNSLPLMKKGDEVEYVKGEYDKKSTKPPTRFTKFNTACRYERYS